MKKWYAKYLPYFEKPYKSIPNEAFEEVKQNLTKFNPENPVGTAVVICKNEEENIFSCLWAISESVCKYPLEVIVIDNKSDDHTPEILEKVGVKWFREEKESHGYARTRGLQEAKGKYYFSLDSDTLYPPSYFERLIEKMEKNPDIIATQTLIEYIPDEKYSLISLRLYEKLRDLHLRLLASKSPELIARGHSFAYRTEYGRKVGYRVNIKRGEDGSLALGLKKLGKIKFVTDKKVRAATSIRAFSRRGSFLSNLGQMTKREIKHLKRYFSSKNEYIDQPENLIS